MPFWNVAKANQTAILESDVKALTEYQSLLDGGATKQEAFAQTLTTASKAAQNHANTIKVTSDSIKTFQTTQEAATKSTTGFAAAGKALAGTLKSIGTTLLNVAIVTAVIKGLQFAYEAIYNQIHATEILRDKIDELSGVYDEAESRAADLNEQLKTASEQIDELQSKDTLTFVEQEELDKLKETNEQLRIMLGIANNDMSKAARELAAQSETLFQGNYQYFMSPEKLSKTVSKFAGDVGADPRYMADAYPAFLPSSDDTLYTLVDRQKAITKLEQATTREEKEALQKSVTEYNDTLYQYLDDLQSIYTNISALPAESLTENQKITLEGAKSGIDFLYSMLEPANFKTGKFEEVFNSIAFKSTKEGLVELSEQGKLTEDVLNGVQYKTLISALEAVGISAEDATQQILAMYPAIESVTAVDSVSGFTDLAAEYAKIKEAQEKSREILGSDTPITTEQYDELIAANAKYASAFDSSTGSIKLNAAAVRDLEAAEQKELLTKLSVAKAQKLEDYKAASKEIAINEKTLSLLNDVTFENLEAQELTSAQIGKVLDKREDGIKTLEDENDALKANQSALADEIKGYDRLASELAYATSAYKRWIDSQNVVEDSDTYEAMQDVMKSITEGLESGKTGTEAFDSAVATLIPDSVDPENEQAIAKYFKTLERYVTEDADGLNNYIQDMYKEGFLDKLADGSYAFNDSASIQEIAKKLNITEELARYMSLALRDYDWNVELGGLETGDAFINLDKAQSDLETAKANFDAIMSDTTATDAQKKSAQNMLEQAQSMADEAQAAVDSLNEPQKLSLMDQLQQQIADARRILADSEQLGIPAKVVAADLVADIAAIQEQIRAMTAAGALITQSVIQGDPTPLLEQLSALEKPNESDPDYGIKYPIYLRLTGEYAEGISRINLDKAEISSPVTVEVTGNGIVDATAEIEGFKSALSMLDGLKKNGLISNEVYVAVKGDWEGKIAILEDKLDFLADNPPIEFTVTGNGITDTQSEIDSLKGAIQALDELKEDGAITEEVHAYLIGEWSEQLDELETRLVDLEEKETKVKVSVTGGEELFKGTSAFDSDEWSDFVVAVHADDAKTALENLSELVETLYGKTLGDLGISEDTLPSLEKVQSIISDLEANKTGSLGDALDTLSAKDVGDLGFTKTNTLVDDLIDGLDKIDAKVIKDKSFTVTQNTVTNGGDGGFGAYASGTNKAKTGPALVGELGREILVSGSQFEVVGQDGAELRNLKRGDIVLNNEETEKVLAGKGTKTVGGKSYATGGVVGALTSLWNKITGSGTKITTTSTSTKKKSTKKKSSSSSSSKTGTFDQLWDWIEVKLTELQEITESFITSAGKAIGYLAQNLNLNSAIASVKTQLDSSKTAYDQYMAQAAKVATKYKLSEAIIDKIQNGSLEISSYDDATKQKIQDYQEWYDKAQDVKKAIEELREQESELAQEKLSNIVNDYENRLDRIDAKVSKAQAQIDKKTAQGKEVTSSDYTTILNQTTSRLNTLTQERAALVAEFEAMVTAGYIQTDSDAWHEYTGQIEELDEALIEAEIDLADFKDSVSAINVTNLQYAMASLENSLQSIQDMQSLHDAQGTANSESSFTSLIQISQQMIQNLQEQNAELVSQQSGLDVVSEKYQEIQSQINENNSSILQAKTSQEEWNDSIVDLGKAALQERRDEIEKTNTASQKQLELQQALEDLEKAKQRRVRILDEVSGKFVYRQDQNAIKEAQNKYDDLMHQETLDKIDEAIDALEESKSSNNIYDYNGNIVQGGGSPLAGLTAMPLESYAFSSDQLAAMQSMFASTVAANQLSGITSLPIMSSATEMRPINLTIENITMNEVNSVGEFFAELTDVLPNVSLQMQYKK